MNGRAGYRLAGCKFGAAKRVVDSQRLDQSEPATWNLQPRYGAVNCQLAMLRKRSLGSSSGSALTPVTCFDTAKWYWG